jgi:glycosyltransferase involved in cell wall biosynthesis
MKRILFIHHATGWGGAPNSLIKLINSLDKSKYEPSVLLIKHSEVAEKLKQNNIKYYVASSLFYKNYYVYFTHSEASYLKFYQILSFMKLGLSWVLSRYYFAYKELRKYNPDIIHLNSSVLTDWLAPASKKSKTVIHIREPLRRGSHDIIYNIFRREIQNYADHVIAISMDNAKRLNLPSKSTVVYNYNDDNSMPGLPISNYQTNRILYVGGSSEIKGFDMMVRLLPLLDDTIKVYFAGYFNMPFDPKTDHTIEKLKYGIKNLYYRPNTRTNKLITHPNAVVLGMVSNINYYLDKSVCLVSPSTVPHFARPIIEAYSRRKPVVATRIEGINELVENGKSGIVVEQNNANGLASAINYLCKNPLHAKNMGDYGFKIATNNFSATNIENVQNIYNTILEVAP